MNTFFSAASKRAAFALFFGLLGLLQPASSPANPIFEYQLPTVGAAPVGITLGPDGAYWFAEFEVGKIGRITTNGVITEYIIPSGLCQPLGITVGPDTNLWFTESKFDQIGRITTNGTVTEYRLPPGLFPGDLALGGDGRLWITDFGPDTPPSGVTTNGGIIAATIGTNGLASVAYYNSNFTAGSRPVNITTGPDGSLYFTEQLAGKIGRITTNGAISEISVLTTNGQPYDITTGPDGAMWFTETATNKLGRVDTALTTVTEYALPTNITGFTADYPAGILLGPDSNIWYTDPQASYVTRVNLTSNQVTMVVTTNIITNFNSTVTTNIATNANATQFFTPTTNSFPERLATGPDGNIWFGEFVGNYPAYFNFIGRFIFPVPLNIQLITNSQVVLSWTTNATTNFVLQTNSDLTTTNWGFATNAPAVVGTNYVVTNQVGASNLFFRLIE